MIRHSVKTQNAARSRAGYAGTLASRKKKIFPPEPTPDTRERVRIKWPENRYFHGRYGRLEYIKPYSEIGDTNAARLELFGDKPMASVWLDGEDVKFPTLFNVDQVERNVKETPTKAKPVRNPSHVRKK